MKRLILLFGVAAICLLTDRISPVSAAEKPPLVAVGGRTIVAFFAPVTDAELQKDADTNEALADFQLYATRVREPLKKAGVDFHELYTHAFRVRVGKAVTTFRPVKVDVGYYFIVPGKEPRIEYGVMTDADLLQVANEYFGATHSATSTEKSVEVPEFSIAVKLSQAAEKRLQTLNESVLVIAYCDGNALPGQGKYNAPFRDVYLGSDERLVDGNNEAKFDHSRVPLSDWNRLSDKDYFVTINTVSARKSAKDNLLDCADPISRKIESFRGKTIEVRCWLLGEPDAPTR
jgi:hypothetical protein